MEVLMSSSILFVFHFVPPCIVCWVHNVRQPDPGDHTERKRPVVVFSLLKRERVGGREGTWNIDRGKIFRTSYNSVFVCIHSAHKSYFLFVAGAKFEHTRNQGSLTSCLYSIYTETAKLLWESDFLLGKSTANKTSCLFSLQWESFTMIEHQKRAKMQHIGGYKWWSYTHFPKPTVDHFICVCSFATVEKKKLLVRKK